MNRIITQRPITQVNQPDSFEKGRLFEEYVISLFNEKHFHLGKWRQSKKFVDPSSFANCGNPDLELVFKRINSHPFAVECKWQARFKNGEIKWADWIKIERYKKFQQRERVIVFIVIGVGGTPSNPTKLFVTPLCNIEDYETVTESQLIEYERKPARRFFYDTVQLRLW